MKKRDRHPLTEGSLALIYKLFFGPLIQYKPNTLSINEWLESLFDVRNREITQYKCTKPFEMPGLYCQAALVRVQGLGFRDVAKGDRLWVRTDARSPNEIEVEFHGRGSQRADTVFLLDKSEWGLVQLSIEEIEE